MKSMRYQAILFDLDGTLLPMDQDHFVQYYFREMGKVLCPLGIEPKALTDAIWAGTKAMVVNDGTRRNMEVFWDTFARRSGKDPAVFRPAADGFYSDQFNLARPATGENPLAVKAVQLAHEKADRVVLATNPLFPMTGQITRMRWVGLSPADFDLVTCYESDGYCKPNPAYYVDICRRLSLEPARCLMIGNDEGEDMIPASSLGMDTCLVTDCRIPSRGEPWQGRSLSFAGMCDWLAGL